MTHRLLGILAAALLMGAVLPTRLPAQPERGPYARIAALRPHDGDTVDFEAGYIRHLEWHRLAKDTWVWYGWNVTFGERQRWFVYATFGHTAASLDSPVSPAEDERDNILNVTPHAKFAGNALYEYLPGLSRGTGEPQPSARLELTTVDLVPGAAKPFEAALSAGQSTLRRRHSGIGWWQVVPLPATSGCVRGPACRRFSKARANRPSLTRSTP